jgi:hypothetical protein
MKRLYYAAASLSIGLASHGCTHAIPLDETAKSVVAGCKVVVIDARTDRQIVTIPAYTTYSYPLEVPLDEALRNRACHSTLAEKPLKLILESAKCQTQGGFSSLEFALRVSVEGSSRPYVAVKAEDAGSAMVGDVCGHNISLAFDAIIRDIERSVSE